MPSTAMTTRWRYGCRKRAIAPRGSARSSTDSGLVDRQIYIPPRWDKRRALPGLFQFDDKLFAHDTVRQSQR
jgi:hypothetical protein